MSERHVTSVWPILHYVDTEAALRYLRDALGFREALITRDDHDQIMHAELRWPEGGIVVFGSTRHTDGVHGQLKPGSGACYVTTDDVDAVYERARRADATIIQAPHDTQFGSGVPTRAFTTRDPEGNLWTFGTYTGVA
jgi:uncharacterized glyoxalase superfamily protein PhnB